MDVLMNDLEEMSVEIADSMSDTEETGEVRRIQMTTEERMDKIFNDIGGIGRV